MEGVGSRVDMKDRRGGFNRGGGGGGDNEGAFPVVQIHLFQLPFPIFLSTLSSLLWVLKVPYEPIKRRLSTDKAARKFRKVLAGIQWVSKYVTTTKWSPLHSFNFSPLSLPSYPGF